MHVPASKPIHAADRSKPDTCFETFAACMFMVGSYAGIYQTLPGFARQTPQNLNCDPSSLAHHHPNIHAISM
jgi:hypothetical protein